MQDKLEEIFSLQKSLAEMMNLDRYPKDVEGKVSALCTAMIHEAVELQRT
ncbi:MAG: dUTPase, partial [Nitrosopumilales archaeon]|nr:dUTPase [Nitrosopumilales archaeon]